MADWNEWSLFTVRHDPETADEDAYSSKGHSPQAFRAFLCPEQHWSRSERGWLRETNTSKHEVRRATVNPHCQQGGPRASNSNSIADAGCDTWNSANGENNSTAAMTLTTEGWVSVIR